MAGITKEYAQARFDKATKALDAAMIAQEYRAGASQHKVMAQMKVLQEAVAYWDRQLRRFDAGGIRVIGGCPA